MGKYFGTDGFRGEANKDLTAVHAFRLGRFLGCYFQKEGERCRIAIGKDTRASGYMLEDALCAGLTCSGADAYLLHVTTTASVAHITRTEGFDCGVMISASHNPYWDNGLKLINRNGEKMEDEVIAACEAFLDSREEPPLATRAQIGRVIDHAAGRNRYMGYLISLAQHSFRGMRVGLDCANGSAWQLGANIFKALGAEVYVIGQYPNGENINLGVGSTHLETLQKHVTDFQLDVGFAFDGDADRCLCVDNNGNVVDGDMIIYLYAKYMQDRGTLGNSGVVATIMSNLGFFRAMERLGIPCEQTDVGDRFVYERMQEKGYVLGGEQSGHIIFGKYATTGDGLLTALKVMQAMLAQKKPLSELLEDYEKYPQVLKNVRVTDKQAALDHKAVQAAVRAAEEKLGKDGRVLLRKSGTEPVLRVMAEARTHEAAHEAADSIVSAIRDNGLAV